MREEAGKEYLYAAGGSRICKLDLDGKVILQINNKPGSDDLGWTNATAVDAAGWDHFCS